MEIAAKIKLDRIVCQFRATFATASAIKPAATPSAIEKVRGIIKMTRNAGIASAESFQSKLARRPLQRQTLRERRSIERNSSSLHRS